MDTLFLLMAGCLGIAIGVIYKVSKINSRQESVDWGIVFKMYFQKDLLAFILSILMVITAVFVSREYLIITTDPQPGLWPAIQQNIVRFTRTVFILIGFGSHVLGYEFFGKAEKIIKSKIDNFDGGGDGK